MCPATLAAKTVAMGRVGANRPALRVSTVMPDTVRVTCENNPEFWMEIDLTSELATGSLPPALERLPGDEGDDDGFRVRMEGGKVRVDAEACPPFWLELYLGAC